MTKLLRQYHRYQRLLSSNPKIIRHNKFKYISTTSQKSNDDEGDKNNNDDLIWSHKKVNAYVSHTFPDFIEFWNRKTYRKVGYGLASLSALVGSLTLIPDIAIITSYVPTSLLSFVTLGYWYIGENDVKQNQHAVRRNYPVIGNFRYILETIRPELRQYIVESDMDGRPFDRMHRAQIYTRAKNVDDTIAFGTRRNLYEANTDFACHSMWPKTISRENARVMIGSKEWGTSKIYSASIFNISAMSYGAISDNAILALNTGAKLGSFYHNTGEGGVSEFHRRPGGDLVYNIGTGYFGCGSGSDKRVFDSSCFLETIDESKGQIKMLEIKLSQGAKPGHGGLLPRAKITQQIADARKLQYPALHDCHSPSSHSAFGNSHELLEFIANLRELSDGLPCGIKMCVGHPKEFATLCKAIVDVGVGPDFITIDGAEGGTGAAPPEFSDSIGLPLQEGLVLARDILDGSNLRGKIKLIASGRITNGFSITRNLALGADITNSARGFMMSLGCIQALKCNSNKCPTGIATQNKDLMFGLDPAVKAVRVYNYHNKTVNSALDIMGAMGCEGLDQVSPHQIMHRLNANEVKSYAEHFPNVEHGSLLTGEAPKYLQSLWNK